MKREYNTILDDADSTNRNNFVPSQSFTWCSPGNFSQRDKYCIYRRIGKKVYFYVLIGRKLTGEFMQKIYAASWDLFTDSWNWKSCV